MADITETSVNAVVQSEVTKVVGDALTAAQVAVNAQPPSPIQAGEEVALMVAKSELPFLEKILNTLASFGVKEALSLGAKVKSLGGSVIKDIEKVL